MLLGECGVPPLEGIVANTHSSRGGVVSVPLWVCISGDWCMGQARCIILQGCRPKGAGPGTYDAARSLALEQLAGGWFMRITNPPILLLVESFGGVWSPVVGP